MLRVKPLAALLSFLIGLSLFVTLRASDPTVPPPVTRLHVASASFLRDRDERALNRLRANRSHERTMAHLREIKRAKRKARKARERAREAAAQRAAARQAAREAASPAGYPDFPYPWDELARCESGYDGSWSVSSGSYYRGYFQFDPGTWRGIGGSGDPAAASADEQLRLAQALQARDGWGPWPVCARKIGLL